MSDDFDEDLYLAVNDDVRMAVANGGFKSGYEHWLMYGKEEEALGKRPKHLYPPPQESGKFSFRGSFVLGHLNLMEMVC